MLKIGDVIQDTDIDVFYEDNLKKINLKDYRGKWLVLLFYPADFTFVCPTELEDAANHYSSFQKKMLRLSLLVQIPPLFTRHGTTILQQSKK